MPLVLLAACLLLTACGAKRVEPTTTRILIDGAEWNGSPVEGEDSGLRVYITLDGAELIDLPFAAAHTVSVIQPDGEENTIELTGDAVYMSGANCENQDCVQMGAVTPENLELRVLGGFIICLPHRLSVEVRGK